ncbi:copper resistance protein CopC [Alteribacillus sp. HJP-4]|uniref:copper resistance CopC family protein n=1 Tax=Alteribacillus sp. HJP-4 TaxID=2775394 RepID=UPI0035CD0A51
MRKKRTWYVVFTLLILAFPAAAGAHTHLESSDPEDGETLSEDTEEIVLTFDSSVQEPNEVTLTGENGEALTPEIIHESEDTLQIKLPDDLQEGDYSLAYSIVGEDGHMMEEELTYTFEADETDQDTAEEESEAEKENATPEEESQNEEEASDIEGNEENDSETEENNQNTFILPAAGGMLIIAALSLIFLLRKKKS